MEHTDEALDGGRACDVAEASIGILDVGRGYGESSTDRPPAFIVDMPLTLCS